MAEQKSEIRYLNAPSTLWTNTPKSIAPHSRL